MTFRFRSLPILAFLTLLPWVTFTAGQLSEEQLLIDVLQSNRPPQEKDAACVQLKRIGTAAAVPALASLLADEDLSHPARLALESIPGPEADAALRAALDRTTGSVLAGILDSIGHRRDPVAVPRLAQLLAHPDPGIAAAAAAALGRIEHNDVSGILVSARHSATGPLRSAILDSLLRHANRALQRGDQPAARAIFLELHRPAEPHPIRTAAYRGLIASADVEGSLALVTAALRADDRADQIAALAMLRDLAHPRTGSILAELLPDLTPVLQAAVMEAMAQRNDRAAAAAVLDQVRSEHPNVQLAAVATIGVLGDQSAIPALLDAAISSHPPLQRAARESLLTLRHGPVTESLLLHLASATGPALAELIRALGGRADPDAIPTLLEFAAAPERGTRDASFRALAMLATTAEIPFLTRLLLDENEPDTREEARRAIATLLRRAQEEGHSSDVTPIVQGITDTTQSPEARVSLLQLCALLPLPEIRISIRTATQDAHPLIRDAAFRALCDTRDPELLPDLLAVAQDPATVAYRLPAIRGFVRLATEGASGIGDAIAVEHLAQILEHCERPEEERIVLAGLATQPSPEALALVVDLLDHEDVQAEAVQAGVRIAISIASRHPELAGSTLHQILPLTTDPNQRRQIEARLTELDAVADYLTAWQVAGPYRQEGQDYAALFDIVFPPEDPAATGEVAWKPLHDSATPRHPGVVDLLQSLGGEQCVAYLRTAVYSPVQLPARLELGTDDGVKAWLNGSLVHTHNVARPLTIGSDHVPVTLQSGWNTLLLKITQNNLGWEFTARFVQPDGSRLPGQKTDPLHAM